MGCCVSSVKFPRPNSFRASSHAHHHRRPVSVADDRSPLPLLLEEETVKEVLSETPVTKVSESTATDATGVKPEIAEKGKILPRFVIKPTEEIVSEESDFCGFTESYSTTTLTEMREDDSEVSQRQFDQPQVKVSWQRQNSCDFSRVKEAGSISPARRVSPSPEKRSQVSSRTLQNRTTTGQRRNVGSQNELRPDPGEGSGWRSRSPEARDKSGTRQIFRDHNRSFLIPNGWPGEMPSMEKRGFRTEKPSGGVPPEAVESLENPLVSLECFIFL